MKKCINCKAEIDTKIKICPNCERKQPNYYEKEISIFLILLIIVSFILIGILESQNSGGSENKCYISIEEFNEIKTGMTYEEVKNIVGCDGTVNSETELMGSKMTIYSWYGKDGISNANINIQDDKLINKTQIGLK